MKFAIAALLCLASAEAWAKKLLYLGDSHTVYVGKITPMGEAIWNGLRQRGHQVQLYAAGGSRLMEWLDTGRVIAGYLESQGNGLVFHDENRVPKLAAMLAEHAPEGIVLNLGDNMLLQRENGRMVFRDIDREQLRTVERFLKILPAGVDCVWIGPTYHPPGNYTKPDAVIDDFYVKMKGTLGGHCRLIDTRPADLPPEAGDGIHHLRPGNSAKLGAFIMDRLYR